MKSESFAWEHRISWQTKEGKKNMILPMVISQPETLVDILECNLYTSSEIGYAVRCFINFIRLLYLLYP